jgi:ubiquinol-cytochrome c reductase cytochrome c subunit
MGFLQVAAVVVMLGVAVAAQSPAPSRPAPASPPASPAPAATDEARKLYVSYGCYQCHGYEAQGSSATGPRLGPRGLPYAAFARYVRRPTGQMPLYTEKVLPEADLQKIHAYTESRPAARAVAELPLLLQK